MTPEQREHKRAYARATSKRVRQDYIDVYVMTEAEKRAARAIIPAYLKNHAKAIVERGIARGWISSAKQRLAEAKV